MPATNTKPNTQATNLNIENNPSGVCVYVCVYTEKGEEESIAEMSVVVSSG